MSERLFTFGIQPHKSKDGTYVLYEHGEGVGRYPSAEASLNAIICEARLQIHDMRVTTKFGRVTHGALVLGDFRRAAAALTKEAA